MMVANWIYRATRAPWSRALTRVMFSLTICLLIGTLMPAAVFALDSHNIAQVASTAVPTTPVMQPATYRYIGQPGGTTEVQRSQDAGLSWLAAGMIPELVEQLAVNPTNDTAVVARSDANLWHTGNSGASWARMGTLPGRPLALAFAGSRDLDGLIFAGTDTLGLFSSQDSGTTWQAAGGPLSPVGAGSISVTALAVNPGDQHVVYAAATYIMASPSGRHEAQFMFISVDDGRRWFEMAPSRYSDGAISRLLPIGGQPLAVLLVAPYGSPMANLQISPALISGLEDADAVTRAATARALGLLHDPSLLPVLLQHLRDPDLLAGDQIAQAIGRLGDPAAVPLLMTALSDTDEVIRARAAVALGLLQTEAAIPQLATMLQSDGPWARRYAAESLAAIGTPEAIAALIDAVRDADATLVSHTAMHGLEMAGQSAVTPLRLALMDKNPVVRRGAAEMLGWLRAADAVPDLVQSLSDQDPAVQTQAGWALGEIHTEPAQLALRQLADGKAGRPILQTAGTAASTAVWQADPASQNEPILPATLAGAIATILLNRWTLGVLFTLAALALLAAMLLLGARAPGHQPRPS